MKFILSEVGNVARQRGRVMVHRLAHENPSHVRPPLALDRRMRVAVLIRILMMNAVRRHPENRPALQSQRGADGQKIFHPLRSLIAAVRQQPVITHANPQAARYPPQKHCDKQRLPGEKEECGNGPNVKRRHEPCRYPVHFIFCRLWSFQILQFHIQRRSPFRGGLSSINPTSTVPREWIG